MRKGLMSACGSSQVNLEEHENENKIKALLGRRCCAAAAFVTGCLHLTGAVCTRWVQGGLPKQHCLLLQELTPKHHFEMSLLFVALQR